MGARDDHGASLRVICGPTAAGKSAIAMALAERFPLVIISADSRQIYRGFDIGTAKPTRDERTRVPHRGLDTVEPTARYSAAAFASDAMQWITEAGNSDRAPVVVGGTGFYIRSLMRPLFEEPALDASKRHALQQWLGALPTDLLQRWVVALDPRRADLGRVQLLRAIEIALLTGRRLTTLHETASRAPRITARYLVVDAGPELAGRMERRIDAMFQAGWLDEVRSLMATVPDDAPAWLGTGYASARKSVRGELTEREAREDVIIATRQYAKRQRTWFRHQLVDDDVTRLDATAPDALDRAIAWWTTQGAPT